MGSTKHHFVPQMHLRQFSANSKGEILVYDKRWQGDPRPKQPSGQCYREHLYSLSSDDGSRSSAIEDEHYSKIDSAAAMCLRRHPQSLNQHRETLSTYLASLILRNPHQIDGLQKNSEPLMTEMYNRMWTDPEFRQRVRNRVSTDEEFESMMNAYAPGNARVQLSGEAAMLYNFGTIASVAASVSNCDWTILVAPRGMEYIISDVPTFTCDPSSPETSIAGLGNPGNETTLPLTPGKCLLIRPGKPGGYRIRTATEVAVREINRRSAYSATARFFASRKSSELTLLAEEFPPRPSVQKAFKHENCVVIPNLVDNSHFSPVWPK